MSWPAKSDGDIPMVTYHPPSIQWMDSRYYLKLFFQLASNLVLIVWVSRNGSIFGFVAKYWFPLWVKRDKYVVSGLCVELTRYPSYKLVFVTGLKAVCRDYDITDALLRNMIHIILFSVVLAWCCTMPISIGQYPSQVAQNNECWYLLVSNNTHCHNLGVQVKTLGTH